MRLSQKQVKTVTTKSVIVVSFFKAKKWLTWEWKWIKRHQSRGGMGQKRHSVARRDVWGFFIAFWVSGILSFHKDLSGLSCGTSYQHGNSRASSFEAQSESKKFRKSLTNDNKALEGFPTRETFNSWTYPLHATHKLIPPHRRSISTTRTSGKKFKIGEHNLRPERELQNLFSFFLFLSHPSASRGTGGKKLYLSKGILKYWT